VLAALLAAGYAALLVAAAYLHQLAFAGSLLAGQVALAAGWFRLVGAPGGGTGTCLAVAAALLADAALLLRRSAVDLQPLAAALGLAVLAGLLQQVLRAGRGRDAAASMAATVTGATVTVLPAGYLGAYSLPAAPVAAQTGAPVAAEEVTAAVLTAVLAGAAVANLVRLLPTAGELVLPTALAAAAGVGAAVGSGTVVADPGRGAVLATAGGGLALVAGMVNEYGDPSVRGSPVPAARWVGATLPLALGGPAAYLLGHFLVG
jgi:hypothetical protein